jgi:hypothetical protein
VGGWVTLVCEGQACAASVGGWVTLVCEGQACAASVGGWVTLVCEGQACAASGIISEQPSAFRDTNLHPRCMCACNLLKGCCVGFCQHLLGQFYKQQHWEHDCAVCIKLQVGLSQYQYFCSACGVQDHLLVCALCMTTVLV